MGTLTSRHLHAVLLRIAATMVAREQELNQADGKLGDGDTGMTLRRVTARMVEAIGEPPQDIGEFFRRAGMAATGATGSSLGTLVAFACLDLGKFCTGRTELQAADIADVVGRARETIATRGKAQRGDKTVLDSLAAIEEACAASSEFNGMKEAAAVAARRTLEGFRDRPNRIGRARMFGERSIGADDPGMLAVALVCEALAEH